MRTNKSKWTLLLYIRQFNLTQLAWFNITCKKRKKKDLLQGSDLYKVWDD